MKRKEDASAVGQQIIEYPESVHLRRPITDSRDDLSARADDIITTVMDGVASSSSSRRAVPRYLPALV